VTSCARRLRSEPEKRLATMRPHRCPLPLGAYAPSSRSAPLRCIHTGDFLRSALSTYALSSGSAWLRCIHTGDFSRSEFTLRAREAPTDDASTQVFFLRSELIRSELEKRLTRWARARTPTRPATDGGAAEGVFRRGFEGAFAERPEAVLTPRRRGLSGEEASTQVISFARSSRSELEKRLTSGGDG